MADRFAAVAPVGGGPLRVPCNPSRGVPVLIHHGRNDELISISIAHAGRDGWIETNGCKESLREGCERHRSCRDGAVVEYCEGDQGHTWPRDATGRIWRFFTEHPMREKPMRPERAGEPPPAPPR
jgi:poly(3-hydroxybutyrate) depolymerase